MKNIAFVVYSHYSRDARVRRYVEALIEKDFSVDVYCLDDSYVPSDRKISLIRYPLQRIRRGKLWYILEYVLFFLFITVQLSIRSLWRRYRFVHINNMPDALVFTSFIPKLCGAKIILDIHDPMPELYMSKFHTKNSIAVNLLKKIEGGALVFADTILTANPEFEKILHSRHSIPVSKITTILNCPDPLLFYKIKNKKKRNEFNLLYMGTIDERFGLDIAVHAMPILLKKIPNLKLTLIPKLTVEGKYFAWLKQEIIRLNLSKCVVIGQPISLEDIALKLETVDVGIVLAKDGVFPNIIFPVKLLEFIQMGIPVIATETRMLRKTFSDTQLYFLKHNTPKEFADAVKILYGNPQMRTNLASNAKKYLEKNNWINEKKKYFQCVENLTDKL